MKPRNLMPGWVDSDEYLFEQIRRTPMPKVKPPRTFSEAEFRERYKALGVMLQEIFEEPDYRSSWTETVVYERGEKLNAADKELKNILRDLEDQYLDSDGLLKQHHHPAPPPPPPKRIRRNLG